MTLGLSLLLAACAFMQNARPSPTWFTQGVMYQIQPRAFTEEGTLKAAEKKLPYLKELGVSIVYLLPVMKMDTGTDRAFWSPRQIKSGFDNPKNQYRIADYFHVDEEYGTDGDLKAFVAAAHGLGLKVLFDLVYLHCGPTAPFLKEHPDFTWWNADGTVRRGPWRFPKLNFANPELRSYLLGNVEYLMRTFRADGFRCDVGDGVPLDFWESVRDRMETVKPGDCVLLCEGYTVCDQYKAFDADYGWFPMEAVTTATRAGDARRLRERWSKLTGESPVGSRFVNHYENHDLATDLRPRRETAFGHAAIDQVHVWLFTADGVPLLFNGNEFAEASPTHSMFGRTPLEWATLETEAGHSRRDLVKRLVALRGSDAVFTGPNGRKGMTWLEVTQPERVTAFVRRRVGKTVLVVQNWSMDAVETDVDFAVKEPPTWCCDDRDDFGDVTGEIASEPLLSHAAERVGARRLKLGGYGYFVAEVK